VPSGNWKNILLFTYTCRCIVFTISFSDLPPGVRGYWPFYCGGCEIQDCGSRIVKQRGVASRVQRNVKAVLGAIFFFWWIWTSGWIFRWGIYVQNHHNSFILVHMRQKKKFALEIAATIDLSPFKWNFDLDKSGQKFHHSLKEHHKISNIPKFRCEML
jgi:hypothetical protein